MTKLVSGLLQYEKHARLMPPDPKLFIKHSFECKTFMNREGGEHRGYIRWGFIYMFVVLDAHL